MRLKLALRRDDLDTTDVVVTADSTATVGDVARSLSLGNFNGSGTLTLAAAPLGEDPQLLDPLMLLSEAPLGSGFEVSVEEATASAYTGTTTLAVMTIHNGPDRGRSVPLARGSSIIGRSEDATIRLDDRMVSREHARVEVSEYGIELVDLNSANGIVIDGRTLRRAHVIPGQIITLGETSVYFDTVADSPEPQTMVLERGGSLLFNRSPRVEVRFPGEELPHPTIPRDVEPKMFPWPIVLAPVLLGLAMFAMTGRVTSLFIVFMAPMMMLGNVFGQRAQQRKSHQNEVARFEKQFDALERTLVSRRTTELERRRAESPSTSTIFAQAITLGPLLWTRKPEHWNYLGIRLGSGRAKSRTTVAKPDESLGLSEYAQRVSDLSQAYAELDDVPLIDILPVSGAVGVAGGRVPTADAVRGIAVQLFGLHSPSDVAAAAILSPSWSQDMEWLKWLPHTSSARSPLGEMALVDNQTTGEALLTALEELIESVATGPPAARGPLPEQASAMELGKHVGEDSKAPETPQAATRIILFVSDDSPVDRARLANVIEHGADVGIFTIFAAPTVESLPSTCRTFIDVTHGLDDAVVGWVRSGERTNSVRVEGVSKENAELFARRLAPVADASSVNPDSSDLPLSISTLKLLGHETADDASAVIERWSQNNSIIDRRPIPRPRLKSARGLVAFVGQGSPDAMTLDLRSQGPHALVGGTTGSGKSEFLQSWVLGMATEYSPDRVTFLFIDYKGGSAFAACDDLPHRVGLVTDLSPHLVKRALTSLRAELHYRERLLEKRGAKDLLEMEKRQDPQTPPALVIVIDEFAALVGEVPEFVDGIVDIAQRGRSLGIHLIMATQRPAGVIKDNLRANTNLRVALRMADESDSTDVVGSKVAASFDPAIPGRGVVKSGPGRLVPFQSGYAGGWTKKEPERAKITVADLKFGSNTEWPEEVTPSEFADTDQGPNDQQRIVNNLVTAATIAQIPRPRRPWLDELPNVIDLFDLPFDDDTRVPLGLSDVPERQTQQAAFFEPDTDGHILVYGTGGSGKSTVLRSLATGFGARPEVGPSAVYALDFGTGALRPLESLPHVGSVIAGDDVERIQRLFRKLTEELDRRGRLLSAENASSLSEYRRITGDTQMPRILLMIDGFATFRQEWESQAVKSAFYSMFMRVLAEGRPLGIHIAATADRYGAVPSAVTANVSKRVVLRMSDEGSYAMLGTPKDVLDETSVPGRAVIDGLECQIATPGGSSNTSEQVAASAQFSTLLLGYGAQEAAPIPAMPTDLNIADMPVHVQRQPVLGIGATLLQPVAFDPAGVFVVAGPPQSGKTTTIRSIAAAFERWDSSTLFFHIGGKRAALAPLRQWHRQATTPEDVRALAKELKEVVNEEKLGKRVFIVLENAGDFAETDAERPLKDLLQAVRRSDHFLVADSDTAQLTSSYGLLGELKAARRGIALRPDTYDGEALFKTAFPKVQRHEFPSGRGIFVEAGKVEIVQIPHVR